MHNVAFTSWVGLLPVATVASSIDRMHFHTNFCCDFPLLVIVSDVIHLADMQLSYPLPPVMEILNNSKMWNCDRSSKTFSKSRNAIERALAQERTDPKTRRRGCLDHLMKDRTTLVIAHRLSTVQNPHQIALCSGGRIAELWTTQSEFLDKEGQFSSLGSIQRLAFE
ncbi:hypothetical protein NC653_029921 [Populus alba x Populus x berolinensis]|uniref:Uncharacterized protein n=1 Tax=Populus alba x Populus x berolinensis TaxID=444605 RepID=A0AAD6Q529_9ROSI|nr:hypothetical protein NC653_029921 [Populus alba x Populus x berolinensis]